MYMAKNKNKIFINYRVRYQGGKISLFDRINKMKNDLRELLPEIPEDKFLSMASHVRNFFYNNLYYGRHQNHTPENLKRKRELTPNEKILLDYYMKNNLNPSTTYRWFLACRIPSDLKEKLAHGKLSFKKAFLIADNRKKSKLSNTGLLMVEEINNVVGSL